MGFGSHHRFSFFQPQRVSLLESQLGKVGRKPSFFLSLESFMPHSAGLAVVRGLRGDFLPLTRDLQLVMPDVPTFVKSVFVAVLRGGRGWLDSIFRVTHVCSFQL